MLRSIFSLSACVFLFVLVGTAQNQELVNVTGKVLSAKDSSEIATSILYEKLPYYDDMGLANANGTGDFSFYCNQEQILHCERDRSRYASHEMNVIHALF